MKKIFSITMLAIIFSVAPVQASDFDLNKDFNSQMIFKSNIQNGRVVVSGYLSLREEPTVNSREIMRIPNGAELILHERYVQGWWEVISATFDGRTISNDYAGDESVG